MRLEEVVAWYQKKIGTYDKQQWEKTIEQKILMGMERLPLKTAKLKTELIDVDLVRGSTFQKAKSKLSTLTICYLAVLRLFFLPLYAKWWVRQTSEKVFVLLLTLYVLQMVNLGIYSYNANKTNADEHIVQMSEFIIPIALSLFLSAVHSQIVATSSSANSSCSKIKKSHRHNLKKRERIRRKRRSKASPPQDDVVTMPVNNNNSDIKDKNDFKCDTNLNNSRKIVDKISNINPEESEIFGASSSSGQNGIRKRNVNWGPMECDEPVVGSSGSVPSTSSSQPFFEKLPYTSEWINGIQTKLEKKNSTTSLKSDITDETDQEDDDLDSTGGLNSTINLTDGAISDRQFVDRNFVTTNSEDCSYSSDLNQSDSQIDQSDDEYEPDAPTIILNSNCGVADRVSCTIWKGRELKKAEMSVLDISSAIIERVEEMPEQSDYVYIGVVLSLILSMIPAFCRLCEATVSGSNATEVNFLDLPAILLEKASFSYITILTFAFGEATWEQIVLTLGFTLRLFLTYLIFFLLTVAERTFKQRFLYAKLFSHITSSRRARKSGIPHFRLNKVRNIKTWLCVRSYLKRKGPQNSVDVIVSATFIITLLLLAFLSVEWLKDSVHLHSQFNLEALVWSCSCGVFLLRFMTLGTKINKKYKSVSVLITEQINLYVQIEQKPNKKEELTISNNVLKLAADLLKELESPFKISGLSANPYLYTTVKVVILSALSGVLSEMLGFKLKLHKIKIK